VYSTLRRLRKSGRKQCQPIQSIRYAEDEFLALKDIRQIGLKVLRFQPAWITFDPR